MPIPALDATGMLPPGVHGASLSEIREAFGLRTPRRQELFAKLENFVTFAQTFQLFSGLFVDGSFVTDKPTPGDIDCVLEASRPNLTQLLQHPQALAIIDGSVVKQNYEVHLFIQPLPPIPTQADMAEFFQYIRAEEALVRRVSPTTKRGILKVNL